MLKLANLFFLLFSTVSPSFTGSDFRPKSLIILNNNNNSNMDVEAKPNISSVEHFKAMFLLNNRNSNLDVEAKPKITPPTTTTTTNTTATTTKPNTIQIKPRISFLSKIFSSIPIPQDGMGISLQMPQVYMEACYNFAHDLIKGPRAHPTLVIFLIIIFLGLLPLLVLILVAYARDLLGCVNQCVQKIPCCNGNHGRRSGYEKI